MGDEDLYLDAIARLRDALARIAYEGNTPGPGYLANPEARRVAIDALRAERRTVPEKRLTRREWNEALAKAREL